MIEDHNNDFVDRNRVESLLQLGAEFTPEREVNYNFAAKALQKKMGCPTYRLPRVMAFCGAASASILAGALMFRLFSVPVSVMPPKLIPTEDGRSNRSHITPLKQVEQTNQNVKSGNEYTNSTMQNKLVEAATSRFAVNKNNRESITHVSRIPKVRWQSETVDRYATGVMTPAWKEDKDAATGQSVYTPVMMTTPVESGETTSAPGSNSNGTVSLVSYEEKH